MIPLLDLCALKTCYEVSNYLRWMDARLKTRIWAKHESVCRGAERSLRGTVVCENPHTVWIDQNQLTIAWVTGHENVTQGTQEIYIIYQPSKNAVIYLSHFK